MPSAPGVLLVLARAVTVLCVITLAVAAAFDTQAARFTTGQLPAEFAARLDGRLSGDYGDVVGVAHNAGDDERAATRAIAYGADAIEIDVRVIDGKLYASHDAPVPLLEDLIFRGPPLRDIWDVASLDDTVLLHLKQGSENYLDELRSFLATHVLRRTIVQTKSAATLRALRRSVPSAQRLLLIFTPEELAALRSDHSLQTVIDGVSVRENLLSPSTQAWLERRGLLTFAWVVNDETRMNELVARGVDGLITDRLDIMRLLGHGFPSVRVPR
jgi:glycerophosphoryl diester phosphodiesterase